MSRSHTALACVAVMLVQTWWMGPAVVGLDVGLALALGLWATRARLAAPESILPLYGVGIAVQVGHFAEELVSGFPHAFPALFGYTWSDARFVAFNLAWLATFGLAALGVQRGVAPAYVVVWFFALAGGIGNGIMHVAMAAARGAYFPGLVTAPILFVIGALLVRRLSS